MPILNYSLVAGDPVSGKVVAGRSAHFEISLKTPQGVVRVAVNIQSVAGSELVYVIKEGFEPPEAARLLALPLGMMRVVSEAGGLALDYARSEVDGEPLVRREEMTLLPQLDPRGLDEEGRMMNRVRSQALQNALVTLLQMAIADKGGLVFAYGSARGAELHDVHRNQGNPAGRFAGENGDWQDGGLLIYLPGKKAWMGVFVGFAERQGDRG